MPASPVNSTGARALRIAAIVVNTSTIGRDRAMTPGQSSPPRMAGTWASARCTMPSKSGSGA